MNDLKKLVGKRKISIYSDTDLDGLVSVLFILAALGFKKIDSQKVELVFLNHNIYSDFFFKKNAKRIKKDPNFKIICDHGYVGGIDLWFDHHRRPNIPKKVNGGYSPHSKSAASLVYEYFKEELSIHSLNKSFLKLKEITDAFDSGQVTLSQIKTPTNEDLLPYVCEIDAVMERPTEYVDLINNLLTRKVEDVVLDDVILKRLEEVKRYNKNILRQIFEPENVTHLNPEGIIIIWIKGQKVKVNSFLPVIKYGKFEMTCFVFGNGEIVDVRVYANPVYKETFEKNKVEGYKNYDLSALPRNYGGGGHRGAGGFTMKREKVGEFIRKLKEIDKLGSWVEKQEALGVLRVEGKKKKVESRK